MARLRRDQPHAAPPSRPLGQAANARQAGAGPLSPVPPYVGDLGLCLHPRLDIPHATGWMALPDAFGPLHTRRITRSRNCGNGPRMGVFWEGGRRTCAEIPETVGFSTVCRRSSVVERILGKGAARCSTELLNPLYLHDFKDGRAWHFVLVLPERSVKMALGLGDIWDGAESGYRRPAIAKPGQGCLLRQGCDARPHKNREGRLASTAASPSSA